MEKYLIAALALSAVLLAADIGWADDTASCSAASRRVRAVHQPAGKISRASATGSAVCRVSGIGFNVSKTKHTQAGGPRD